jgi:TRAP-type C4-dicarboxylate transport system substrate-binding protein
MKRSAFAAAAAAVLFAGAASAAEVNLRYAHFMPAASWQNTVLFEDWGKAVEEQSGGKIDVTVYPAQTLGKAPAGYDNAKSGIAEIAWTVQGYTANRFPLSQVVELPGLFETAEVGSCAFQKLYESGALDEEYKDTHVLFVHVHGPGHLHTKDKVVTKLDDLKELKIRQPTPVIGNLLKELGAVPVGMPAPAIYESTQRGTIDGFLLPWEAVEGFRAYEVADQHTELGLYQLAFVSTMNKQAYENLSPELKKVIDDNSGMKWSMIAGKGFDEADVSGKKASLENGTLHQIDEAEKAKWQEAADRATELYLAELEGKGLPGRETLAQFKEYVSECQ